MSLLQYGLSFLGICYGFWLHFLVFSAYKAAIDDSRKIPLIAKVLIAPVILAGGLIDASFNTVFGWVMFGEIPFKGYTKNPTTWMLTYRCDRHLAETTWRGAEARWFCRNLLDPFQSGGHCHGI